MIDSDWYLNYCQESRSRRLEECLLPECIRWLDDLLNRCIEHGKKQQRGAFSEIGKSAQVLARELPDYCIGVMV